MGLAAGGTARGKGEKEGGEGGKKVTAVGKQRGFRALFIMVIFIIMIMIIIIIIFFFLRNKILFHQENNHIQAYGTNDANPS